MREVLDFNELKTAGNLPSPKGVALKVMQLCQDEALSLKELAQTIQGDPSLAGRIIKIANYVNPNRARPIASVTTDTLILIGIQAVRQVVLGLSLVGNYREGRCKLFEYENFWSHSVAVGSAAHAICSAIRVSAPAEMFNCGLMSGIGQLTLVTVRPESYCEMLAELPATATSKDLQAAQQERFGITQRDMTMLMLQDWGIPKLFIDALYHHEDPAASNYAENSRPLRITYTLQLASLLADVCLTPDTEEPLRPAINELGDLLEIPPEQLDAILVEARQEWQEWCSLLGVKIKKAALKEAAKIETPAPRPAQAPSPAPAAPFVPPANANKTPLRILIASHNEPLRTSLNQALQSLGHSVTLADTGSKAIQAIAQSRPQVLLADWLLPELDGLSLCRKLRGFPATEKIYCMIISQFEEERRKIEAYDAGADDIIQMPINPRLLLAQLTVPQRYIKLFQIA